MTATLNGLRAILFDFGGTLDGPGEPWVERFATAYRDAGLAVPFDQLQEAVGIGTREAYHAPQVAGFDLRATVTFHVRWQLAHLQIDHPRAAEAIVELFVTRTLTALAASRALLARLRRRFQLGVVSNFYGNVERILAEAAIAPLLAVVVDSTVVGVSKPDPRIFTLAMERLNVPPTEALYVGDSLQQDILPARAAGLRTAWLAGHHPVSDGSTAADLCLPSLTGLERAL